MDGDKLARFVFILACLVFIAVMIYLAIRGEVPQ